MDGTAGRVREVVNSGRPLNAAELLLVEPVSMETRVFVRFLELTLLLTSLAPMGLAGERARSRLNSRIGRACPRDHESQPVQCSMLGGGGGGHIHDMYM